MKLLCSTCLLVFFTLSLWGQSSKLFGTVVDEEGSPYAFITLSIDSLDLEVTADENGYYEFASVPIGDYPLVIKHEYGNVYKAVYMDGADYEYNVIIRRRIRFDDVIVSATRSAQDEPVNRELLNKEEISKRSLHQDLPYTLKQSRSVVVSSDAGTGIGYTGVRIRGLDPSHVNVTLNGIPLNDAESQLVFWVDLPDLQSSTENIEIQRGMGSSGFGAGDLGAALSVNTNKINTQGYFEVKGGLGSYGTLSGTVSGGTGLMDNRYTIDGRISKITSDGYIDRARANLTSIYLSGAWIGNHSSLRLNVLNGHEVTYQAWYGVPFQYVGDKSLRTFNSAGQDAVEVGSANPLHQKPYDNEVDDYNQTHVQLFYNYEKNKSAWSSALFLTRGLGFFELYQKEAMLAHYNALIGQDTTATDNLVERRWLDNYFYGANTSWSKTMGRWKLKLATSYTLYDGDHYGQAISLPDTGVFKIPREYYRNQAKKTDWTSFGKVLYQWSDHLYSYLDLQYRNVRYKYDGIARFDRPIVGDHDFHFFNPKAGLTYLSDGLRLYFSYGRGQKEPNRNDFVDRPEDRVPQPEVLDNFEIGYEHSQGTLSWGIHGYYMYYTNQLVLTGEINDVGESIRTNVGSSYRRGIELEAGWNILGLALNANCTFSQNIIDSFTEYIDEYDQVWGYTGQRKREFQNVQMSFSPDIVGFFGAEYAWKNPFHHGENSVLSFFLHHKYVGRQYLDNTENRDASLEPYLYADAGMQYHFALPKWKMKDVSWTLKVLNIYNTLYETNGWNYRFAHQGVNPIEGDPYGRSEGSDLYTLTGLFPQAPIQLHTGLSVRF